MADSDPSKGPWIIAASILLGAALIVGAMAYFRSQDQSCADWQQNYRMAVAKGTNSQALAEKLYGSKPEGCVIPP